MGHRFATRGRVDCPQRPGNSGNGFHPGSDPKRSASTHATLDSSSALAEALNTGAIVDNLVMRLRTAPASGRKTVTDLNALDGLNAHQCAGQSRVKAAIPVHIGAQPRGQPADHYLDDSSEGVAVFVRLVHLRNHGLGGLCVRAPQGILIKAVPVGQSRNFCIVRNRHRPNGNGVGDNSDSQLGEQSTRNRT
jgi:hypothetical protein